MLHLPWAADAALGSPAAAGTVAVPQRSTVASAAHSDSMAVCPRPRLGLGIVAARRLGAGRLQLRAPRVGRRLVLGFGMVGMPLLLCEISNLDFAMI